VVEVVGTNYFRKYMQGYAKVAAPLHRLTKSTLAWERDSASEDAFIGLKRRLSTAPVLAMPDMARLFTVISDACNVSGGAILMQDDRVVAYHGRK